MAEVVVLGAGMIGVTTALALQARGHGVTLIDRHEPGRETSFGNAGIIQAEAAEPYGFPREFSQLLQVALGRSVAARWNLPGLMSMGSALWSYYRASAPESHKKISAIYSKMTLRSTQDHEPLIEASGAGNLISRNGFYVLFRSKERFGEMPERLHMLREEYGLGSTLLNGEELLQTVSGLRRAPVGAVHWPQSWRASDPGALVGAYAALFETRGGQIEKAAINVIEPQGGGWRLLGEGVASSAEHVVVALGPWTPQFLQPLGYRFPMIAKRGYHGHFEPDAPLSDVLVDETNGVVATPMNDSIRITTGASFVRQSTPASYRQFDDGVKKISEFAPLRQENKALRWMGTRPCMPDMMPVVGKLARHDKLWVNFGHGHHGFTLGPTTAEIFVDAFDGRENPFLMPLSPERFSS